MKIPCYIIVFNQKKWLPALIEDVKRIGAKPIIFDMNSTWDELKKWYKEQDIEIIFHDYNTPVFRILDKFEGNPYFIITDPDLDLSGVPDDCIEKLLKGFELRPDVWKVGLSLEIEDLPDTEFSEEVKRWERQFWKYKIATVDGIDYFLAPIDTTFAIYDMSRYQGRFFEPAIRLGRPYTARHQPWYYSREQLLNDEELKVYYSTANTMVLHWTRKIIETADKKSFAWLWQARNGKQIPEHVNIKNIQELEKINKIIRGEKEHRN